MVREFGMDLYTLLYLKHLSNRDLWYSTGNSAQCYVAAWMGGEFEENVYVYMYAYVCCAPEITFLIGYISIQNKKIFKKM